MLKGAPFYLENPLGIGRGKEEVGHNKELNVLLPSYLAIFTYLLDCHNVVFF